MENKKISRNTWTIFFVFGLVGQIAWTIENMYLNVYIYKTVTYDPSAIATMVALSAIVATVATLSMGALSDKLGIRKIFMTIGYLVWGISIISFGYINQGLVSSLFPVEDVVLMTLWIIIIMDCIMTFIGSTANDAAFQSWVTDVTNPSNRGKAEGLIATMPLLGMLVVFGLLDGFTQNEMWKEFFWIVGIIVIISGLLGIFLIKDGNIKKKESHYLKDLAFGFNPKTIKENKMLYIVFVAVAFLGIAQQVFMPYFIIYFEFYVGITNYAILLGAVLILSSIISVIGGRLMDTYGKRKFLVFSTILYIIGMFAIYILGITLKDNLTLSFIFTLIFGVMTMGSYLVAVVVLNAMGRDLVPKTHVGVFSGVRMIFLIMIPMVIGPFIGSAVIKASDLTYVDAFGVIQSIPTPGIFLAGSIIAILAFIPFYWILKHLKKHETNNQLEND
jgi:MFS family permease